MLKRYISLLPLMLLASACQQPTSPVTAAVLAERVYSRNYTLGIRQVAYVGQSLVRVKDYYVRKRQGGYMRASAPFRVRQALGGWIDVSGKFEFPVVAKLRRDRIDYQVVAIRGDTSDYTAVLVGPQGTRYPKLAVKAQIMTGPVLMAGEAHFEPEDVKFIPGPDESLVDSSAGFVNFELIYGGTDGRSFTLTYREYTPQDLIRPAYTQTLTYQNDSPTVRFREVELQVHEVTGEHIAFTVIAGLP